MIWFYLAIIAAIGFAATVLISKHIMQDTSSLEFATTYSILATIFYLPIFAYFLTKYSILDAGLTAWIGLSISGIANTAALIASSKAIKEGEVSTVTPLIRTQPLFAAIIGIFALGEAANISKLAGIVLVTAGGYTVLLKKKESPIEPLKHLLETIPAKLGVLAGFLYATGAVADRFALQGIQPELYNFLLLSFMGISFTGYLLGRDRKHIKNLKEGFLNEKLAYLVVGAATAIAYYSLVKALSMTEASKVVPILQAQVLFVVGGGFLFYKEEGIYRKIAGSILLIIGVVFIVAPNLIPY